MDIFELIFVALTHRLSHSQNSTQSKYFFLKTKNTEKG